MFPCHVDGVDKLFLGAPSCSASKFFLIEFAQIEKVVNIISNGTLGSCFRRGRNPQRGNPEIAQFGDERGDRFPMFSIAFGIPFERLELCMLCECNGTCIITLIDTIV